MVKFSIFARDRLKFERPPRLFLRNDEANAKHMLGKTAHYDPNRRAVTVFMSGRHPKDIIRSFAHELVHHCQNERGDLAPEKMKTMNKNYAQECPHMRKMEQEAYLEGNMCFRDWEDSLDDKLKYTMSIAENIYLKENKLMNKQTKKQKELTGMISRLLEKKINILREQDDIKYSFERAKQIQNKLVSRGATVNINIPYDMFMINTMMGNEKDGSNYTQDTYKLIAQFQRDYNDSDTGKEIAVDGVIGPDTTNALMNEPALGPKYAQLAALSRGQDALDTMGDAIKGIANQDGFDDKLANAIKDAPADAGLQGGDTRMSLKLRGRDNLDTTSLGSGAFGNLDKTVSFAKDLSDYRRKLDTPGAARIAKMKKDFLDKNPGLARALDSTQEIVGSTKDELEKLYRNAFAGSAVKKAPSKDDEREKRIMNTPGKIRPTSPKSMIAPQGRSPQTNEGKITKAYLKELISGLLEEQLSEGHCGKREDECKDENCPTHSVKKEENLHEGEPCPNGCNCNQKSLEEVEELEEKKKGKYDDGDGKDEKCDYVDCSESKIQTPEQESALYESRFTQRNTRLFEKLLKEWTK